MFNFPINRLLVCWFVMSAGPPAVCHIFLKGREVLLPLSEHLLIAPYYHHIE